MYNTLYCLSSVSGTTKENQKIYSYVLHTLTSVETVTVSVAIRLLILSNSVSLPLSCARTDLTSLIRAGMGAVDRGAFIDSGLASLSFLAATTALHALQQPSYKKKQAK